MATWVNELINPASENSGQQRLLLRLEIDEFNARYAAVLDRGNLSRWPEFFAADPLYRITSRENFDANLPISLIYCDSKGMLVDRADAIQNTMVFEPRVILHFITNVEVNEISGSGIVAAQSNFLLVENLVDRNPRLLMAGRYVDKFVREDGELLLKERHCVYDTVTVQTSVIYPV